MRRLSALALAACVLAGIPGVLASIPGVLARQAAQPAAIRRIAIFGSSVANGTGDESGQEGYAGLLRALLEPRGWEIVNRSRGGDNTKLLMSRFAPNGEAEPGTRFLLPAPSRVRPDRIVPRQRGHTRGGGHGSQGHALRPVHTWHQSPDLSEPLRGDRPVVTLCYARNDFTDVEYSYTRRANAAINQWGVPSVNLLGAVDDGTGKWVNGFWWDSLHPNAAGHAELAATFVPSLFEALERGSGCRGT